VGGAGKVGELVEYQFPLVKEGFGVYVGKNRHAVRGAEQDQLYVP